VTLSSPPDVFVPDHGRQAVRAEEEEIAGLDRDREGVHVDLGIRAERACDYGALRVRVGLLGGEPAAPDEVGDEGVILGQLLEPSVAQAVGPRVADMADDQRVAADEGGRDRRPHPGDLRVVGCALVDAPVRLLDDRRQPLLRLELVRPVELAEGRCGESRGDFAGLRASHAVRDREERWLDDERILVPPPFAARVGEAGAVQDLHRSNLSSVSPIWTRSPR